MRSRQGVRRGYERLSDRLGSGLSLEGVRLIDEFAITVASSGVKAIPPGTLFANLFAGGAGGSPARGLNYGGGGGSAEYLYVVPQDGLSLSWAVGAGQTGGGTVGNTTIDLPLGLGTLMGGGANVNVAGSGSGPVGTVAKSGGQGTGNSNTAQGPFPGEYVSTGGGAAAGPFGGNGDAYYGNSGNRPPKLGGGGSVSGSANGADGWLYMRFFGVLP